MENKLKQLRNEFVFYIVGEKGLANIELKDFLDGFIAVQADEYWDNYFTGLEKKTCKT